MRTWNFYDSKQKGKDFKCCHSTLQKNDKSNQLCAGCRMPNAECQNLMIKWFFIKFFEFDFDFHSMVLCLELPTISLNWLCALLKFSHLFEISQVTALPSFVFCFLCHRFYTELQKVVPIAHPQMIRKGFKLDWNTNELTKEISFQWGKANNEMEVHDIQQTFA